MVVATDDTQKYCQEKRDAAFTMQASGAARPCFVDGS